jgi:hypothetical protein
MQETGEINPGEWNLRPFSETRDAGWRSGDGAAGIRVPGAGGTEGGEKNEIWRSRKIVVCRIRSVSRKYGSKRPGPRPGYGSIRPAPWIAPRAATREKTARRMVSPGPFPGRGEAEKGSVLFRTSRFSFGTETSFRDRNRLCRPIPTPRRISPRRFRQRETRRGEGFPERNEARARARAGKERS